jgi:hypothetical protein
MIKEVVHIIRRELLWCEPFCYQVLCVGVVPSDRCVSFFGTRCAYVE